MLLFFSAYSLLGLLATHSSSVRGQTYNLTCKGGDGFEPTPLQPEGTKSPVTTPSPVTPSPVTSSPVSPAPITPAPITPSPTSLSPVTPSPSTATPTVEGEQAPSETPSEAPSQAPVTSKPTPGAPTPDPDTRRVIDCETGCGEEGGDVCSSTGDPHLRTFDGLKYDCQGRGDLVLVKSLDSDFEIHARFGRPDTMNKLVSWTTGVAVKEGDSDIPVIEMSLFDPFGGSCNKIFIVDGKKLDDPATQFAPYSRGGLIEFEERYDGEEWVLTYWNGLEVRVRDRARSHFGCSLSTYLFKPLGYRPNDALVGLMGNNDGSKHNDFIKPDGTILNLPSKLKGKEAYGYCMNWCMKHENTSLFDYGESGTVFDDINGCEDPVDYLIPEPETVVPDEVIIACAGVDADVMDDCILDVWVGDNAGNFALDAIETAKQDTRTKKWLVCGKPTHSDCVKREGVNEMVAFLDEQHEFACCTEDSTVGWPKKDKCDVYGTVDITMDDGSSSCGVKKTHAEAASFCQSKGGRLCSRDEIFDGCVADTGCSNEKYYRQMLWTESAPVSGSTIKPWVACGEAGKCTEEYGQGARFADPSELHEVKCCSDAWKEGWKKHGHCNVWAEADFPGVGCLASKTLAQAAAFCQNFNARLCTREELIANCANDAGKNCGFDDDYVWTKSLGVEPEQVVVTPTDPYAGVAKGWLYCADRTDSRCVKREGANQVIAAVEEEHEVICCADEHANMDSMWKTTRCSGLYAAVDIAGHGCIHRMTFDEAKTTCTNAGGRLCTKEEVFDDICLKDVANTCEHDLDLVWTSEPAPAALDSYTWAGCGEREKCVEDHYGQGGRLDTPDIHHEVVCCSNDYHLGWKKHGHCNVWAWAVDCEEGKTYDLQGAMDLCAAQNARLCTKAELVANCANDAGTSNCKHDKNFVWTSTPGWLPTNPPADVDLNSQNKYYISCGDNSKSDCVKREGRSTIVAAESEDHEVRCCSDGLPAVAKAASADWTESSTCPGTWVASSFSKECIHDASFDEAVNICSEYGGRLCSHDELQRRCTKGSSCDHDKDLVWSSTPVTNSLTSLMWVACGERGKCSEDFGRGGKLVEPTEKYPVRCCSEDYHYGWKKHGHCDVWAWSKFNDMCYDEKTYDEAIDICANQGARLCTKEELMDNCANDAGCHNEANFQFDKDFVWTKTPGWEEHIPVLPDPRDTEDKYWLACADRTEDKCMRYEGVNTQVAAESELHELMCCVDKDDTVTLPTWWIQSKECPLVYAAAEIDGTCYHSVDHAQAESICSENGGRLCTKEEVIDDLCLDGIANKCDNHRYDLIWTADAAPKDDELIKQTWVACGERDKCDELYGWGARLADEGEMHQIRCCSDDYMQGWKKHGHCDVYAMTVGSCDKSYSFQEATDKCEAIGARLCTKDELVRNCGNDANGGGCQTDDDLVWTKTTGWVDNSAEVGDTYATDEKKWLVCGKPNSECTKYDGADEIVAAVTEQHEVICCDDDDRSGDGWKQNSGCSVWAEAELPYCFDKKSYAEAEAICLKNNARLCTKKELLDGCGKDVGCDHNKDLVWSDSTVDSTALTEKHWLSCGRRGNCKDASNDRVGGALALPTEVHPIKCCSDNYRSGWYKNGNCDVWGKSAVPGCETGTLAVARDVCASYGARLCTKHELNGDCVQGGSCANSALVWSYDMGWESS